MKRFACLVLLAVVGCQQFGEGQLIVGMENRNVLIFGNRAIEGNVATAGVGFDPAVRDALIRYLQALKSDDGSVASDEAATGKLSLQVEPGGDPAPLETDAPIDVTAPNADDGP